MTAVTKKELNQLEEAQKALAKLCDLGVISDDQEADYFGDFLFSKVLDYEKYEDLLGNN